jgi:hypothetical protein
MLLRKEAVEMKPELDLGPLLRCGAGGFRTLDTPRSTLQVEPIGSYPSCGIGRPRKDPDRLTLAVAVSGLMAPW